MHAYLTQVAYNRTRTLFENDTNVKYSPSGQFIFVLMIFVSESVNLNATPHEQHNLYHQVPAFQARTWVRY